MSARDFRSSVVSTTMTRRALVDLDRGKANTGAAYMVSNMSSDQPTRNHPAVATGFATLRRRASGKCRISRIAMFSSRVL